MGRKKVMEAVIMAGGLGSRLLPLTNAVSKHLIPVYDKPLIFYPIYNAMLAGIKKIHIICKPSDIQQIQHALKFCEFLNISFIEQEKPEGIAHGIRLVRPHIQSESFLFLLGDNIFIGPSILKLMKKIQCFSENTVFGYSVTEPHKYGVAEISREGAVIRIVEKPAEHIGDIALTGMYVYRSEVFQLCDQLQPSCRGELEISDLNQKLLTRGKLDLQIIDPENFWIDCGSPERVFLASNFVRKHLSKTGKNIGCLEELAFKLGWFDEMNLQKAAIDLSASDYGQYLLNLQNGSKFE